MAKNDLLYLLIACLVFLLFVPLAEKSKQKNTFVAIIFFLPPIFLSLLVFTWGRHMLAVSGKIDSKLMYIGVAAEGTPYLSTVQVDSPTYFAFMRFAVNIGDGSLQLYEKILDVVNYASIAIIVVSLVLVTAHSFRKKGKLSSPTVTCLFCSCIIGLLVLFRNIELANTNIWVAGFVALYLASRHLSKNKWTDFLGGMSLGIAFMIKPYLLMVLVFVFFSSFRNRNFGQMAGVAAAGVIGFFASLMVSGMGLDTYRQFLLEVTKTVYYDDTYYRHLYADNLSLLKYLPLHLVGKASLLCTLLFGLLAYISGKGLRNAETPWFFVTLLPFPIIWDAHLMGIFPALIFFLLNKRTGEQILICSATAILVFFSNVTKIPIIPNCLLLALWAWGIRPMHFISRQTFSTGSRITPK